MSQHLCQWCIGYAIARRAQAVLRASPVQCRAVSAPATIHRLHYHFAEMLSEAWGAFLVGEWGRHRPHSSPATHPPLSISGAAFAPVAMVAAAVAVAVTRGNDLAILLAGKENFRERCILHFRTIEKALLEKYSF